jgi:signal recognition particle subunit SRP54
MRKGKFDLEDLRDQLAQMEKIGGVGGMLGMMPGIAKMKSQLQNANLDDRLLKRQRAIIDSMTPQERRNARILNGSRRKRIAAGSGTTVQDVNRLMKNFQQAEAMIQRMTKGGMRGMGRNLPFSR